MAFSVYANGKKCRKQDGKWNVPKDAAKPWENEVTVFGITKGAEFLFIEKKKPARFTGITPKDPLAAAGESLARFVVSQGPDAGEMFSFYDPVDETFRLPLWRWDTGICLEALAGMAAAGKAVEQAALSVSMKLSAQVLADDRCPGGFPEVTDLHTASPKDKKLPMWVVPFNGAFIGAGLWAAAKVFARHRDDFQNLAMNAHSLVIHKGLTGDGFLAGYYHLTTGEWRYHGQINDSGIFTRLTGIVSGQLDPSGLAASMGYARTIQGQTEKEGYIRRAWYEPRKSPYPEGAPLFPEWRRKPGATPAKIFARGQAWCLLGLGSMAKLTQDEPLAQTVTRITGYLLQRQRPDGLWPHDLGRQEQAPDLKGSAVIAWALLETLPVFESDTRKKAADAAQKAWQALSRLYRNPTTGFPGGFVEESREGAIIYFRHRPMVCAYATAAYILAGLLLEKNHAHHPCL